MDSASCVWTPDALGNDLYAVWLTNGQHVHPNWTISPPWTPKEEEVSPYPLSLHAIPSGCNCCYIMPMAYVDPLSFHILSPH